MSWAFTEFVSTTKQMQSGDKIQTAMAAAKSSNGGG
jgi:hypothetical protein